VTAYNKKNPEQAIEDVSSVELFYDEEKKKRLVKVDEPIGKLLKQFSDIFVAPKQTATSANKPTEPKGEDIAEEVKKEENKEPEKPKIPVEEAIALDKAKAGASSSFLDQLPLPSYLICPSATLKDEGNKCMNEKKYQEAVEKYSVAIELDPTNAVLYSNRAQAHLSIDKHHGALFSFSFFLSLLCHFPSFRCVLLSFLAALRSLVPCWRCLSILAHYFSLSLSLSRRSTG